MNGNKKLQVATCKICQIYTKFSRNSTNHIQHLRVHHPEAYMLIEPNIQKPPSRDQIEMAIVTVYLTMSSRRYITCDIHSWIS